MKLKYILISIFALTLISTFIWFSKQNTKFPENLIGTWTTSEKKYIDRFFELTPTTITYGIGREKTNVYNISNVKKDVQNNTVLYTIEYHNSDGVQYTRSFYYDTTKGGVIKFKNQEDIPWTKKKDTHNG